MKKLRESLQNISLSDVLDAVLSRAVLLFSQGFVLMQMWNWFVADTLLLPRFDLWSMLGVLLFFRLLSYKYDFYLADRDRFTDESEEDGTANQAWLSHFSMAWGVFLAGLALHALSQ